MVTHDPVAAAYTDRVVFLADGRVVDELRDPDREQVLEIMARMAAAADARLRHGDDHAPPCKSLLGRKVRLLMSTFAIVLGRRVRGRLAGLLRHPEPQLHRAVRLDRRRRGRPARRRRRRSTAAPVDARPSRASLVDDLAPAAGRGPRRRQRQRGRRLRRRQGHKVVGGFGPPAIGANWSDAPAGHGLEGLPDRRRPARRTGRDEVVLDDQHRRARRATTSATRSDSSPRPARPC